MGGARRAWRRVVGAPAAVLLTGGLAAGVVAVTSTPAGAATDLVTTESQLRTDFNSNSFDTLVLQNDIHLSVGVCARLSRTTANNPITIDGQGQFKIVQDCSGFGVITVPSPDTSNVTLRGVTITGGNMAGDGAGIEFEGGSLTVDHSTFVNNHTLVPSGNDGGAIDSEGTGSTTVIDSTFTNNSADDDGGAINCDDNPQTITITGSTFNGNSTSAGSGNSGGAIDAENDGCAFTITNSTITANTSGDDAAISLQEASDSLKLVYSSVVNNATNPASPGPAAIPGPGKRAPDAGGRDATEADQVHAANDNTSIATANLEITTPANLSVVNSFLARPHGGPNCSDATGAPLTGIVSGGYNVSDDSSCGLTAGTDKQGAGNDPGVGPLANNGGPTQTVLPLPGSILIDAIPAAACQAGLAAGVTTDQRGIARPQGPGCDIGAVEVVVPLVVQPRFTG